MGETKQITMQPVYVSFSGSLSGSVQEVESSASDKDSNSKTEKLIAQLEEALARDPNNSRLHFFLAAALLKGDRQADAIFHYSEVVRLDGSDYVALNNLAWIRASHPDSRLRDCAESIRLAGRACELTGYKDPFSLDTLAIAYAEAQQFTEAISMAEKALELANSTNQQAVADEIQGHLVIFRAGKPFREAAPLAAPAVSDR